MSNRKPHFVPESQPEGQEIEGVYTIEFAPRQLSIVWGKDKRYWELPAPSTNEPAKLSQVSWLEVTGSTKAVEAGTYRISFEIEMKPGAFGWSGCPLLMMAKVGKKGKYRWKRLAVPNVGERKDLPTSDNFTISVPPDSPDKQIFFGLYEIWTGRWKGGLEIYNAKVRKIDETRVTQSPVTT